MNAQPPPLRVEPPRSWWSRNWLWFVPAFLATGVLTVWLAALSFFSILRGSEAYQIAWQITVSDERVITALGSPVEERWWVIGGLEVEKSLTSGESRGSASYIVPVRGPKVEGSLHVNAEMTNGEWEFDILVLYIEATDEHINLLTE